MVGRFVLGEDILVRIQAPEQYASRLTVNHGIVNP